MKAHGGVQQLLRVAWTAPGQWLELPALCAIVAHEELLQLIQRPLRQIAQLPRLGLIDRSLRYRQQAIVAERAAALGLLRLEDPDQPRGHQASGKARMVREKRDVERIAVRRGSARNCAEIARKVQAQRQYTAQLEQP